MPKGDGYSRGKLYRGSGICRGMDCSSMGSKKRKEHIVPSPELRASHRLLCSTNIPYDMLGKVCMAGLSIFNKSPLEDVVEKYGAKITDLGRDWEQLYREELTA